MNEVCNQAAEFLDTVFQQTGLELQVTTSASADGCVLDLDGRDAELLQAEGGALLESLQHLVSQAFGRGLPRGQRLVCDVHGFRATREAELRAMALHAANQVRANGTPFTFGAMSAGERRIIHMTLAEATDLLTESVGEGADRKLRVGLKK